jgi:type VI secretion system protein ImpF
MAQLTPRERLQPSLLQRLTDDRPGEPLVGNAVPVLTLDQLKEDVRRELGALLNATALDSVVPLHEFPHAQRSVINFGIPDLSGKTASGLNPQELEETVGRMIRVFEPRLRNIRVQAITRDEMSHNRLSLRIAAELWAQPLPQQLMLRTELDLESGEVLVEETRE